MENKMQCIRRVLGVALVASAAGPDLLCKINYVTVE
jgi:hypothetical protein